MLVSLGITAYSKVSEGRLLWDMERENEDEQGG